MKQRGSQSGEGRTADGCGVVFGVGRMALALAAVVVGQGCLPQVESAFVDKQYPTPGRAVTTFERKRDGVAALRAQAIASPAGDVIRVSLRRAVDCERVTRTDMTSEVGTRRTLRGGTAAQVTNLTVMALLVAGGIATYASAPCVDPGQCSAAAQEKADGRRGAGLAIAGSGAVPAGLFVWNMIRASDDVDARPAPVREEVTPRVCPSQPARAVPITVRLGTNETAATTGDDGTVDVVIPWSSLGETLPSTGVVRAQVGTGFTATAPVDLTELEPYRTWAKKKHEEGERAAAARRVEERVRHRADVVQALERAESILSALAAAKTWTAAGMESYREAVERIGTVQRNLPELSVEEGSRAQRARDKIAALAPSYDSAMSARQAQLDANLVQMGRTYILSRARAPASVRFVSDTIMLRCPGGYMLMHDFDAQNAFGAMLRGSWAVTIDTRKNRVDGDDCQRSTGSFVCAAAVLGCGALGME